jgi:RimJ/RimL family protein N-acetyltransferase
MEIIFSQLQCFNMVTNEIKTQLKDGTKLVFRLLRPEDEGDIKAGFEKLSPQSRYYRFLAPVSKLPNSHMKFISQIDNVNRVGWCAIDRADGHEIGIGLARYERLVNEPNKAEFAITIVDAYQNRGIGSILLKLLIQTALKNGITTFVGFVLEENRVMLHILKRYHGKLETESGTLLRVEMDLTAVDQDQLIIPNELPVKM